MAIACPFLSCFYCPYCFLLAYSFPDYFSLNLDSAEEIIEGLKEEGETDKLSLQSFFDALLVEEPMEERKKIWAFLAEHFEMRT